MIAKFDYNLEQFQSILLFFIKLFCFDFSITNLVLVNFITVSLVLITMNILKLRFTMLVLFSYFLVVQKPETEKFPTYQYSTSFFMDFQNLDAELDNMLREVERQRRPVSRSLLRIFLDPNRVKTEGIHRQSVQARIVKNQGT